MKYLMIVMLFFAFGCGETAPVPLEGTDLKISQQSLGATSQSAFDQLSDARAVDNLSAAEDLHREGKLIILSPGDEVRLIESGVYQYTVKILDGPYQGQEVIIRPSDVVRE